MALKQLYIDLETTGLTEGCAILQIACIVVINRKITRRFVINMNPSTNHRIERNGEFHQRHRTKNVLSQKRGFEKFIKELEIQVDKYKPKDKFHFIAFNAGFDSTFLRNWFLENKYNYFGSYFHNPALCLMQKAMWILQEDRNELENYQLGTICEHVGIKINKHKLHDGEYDIDISYQLDTRLDNLLKQKLNS